LVAKAPVAVETTLAPVPASTATVAEVPAPEVAAPGESPQSEESYEWVNRIGLELLAPQPKPHRGWRIPLAVGLVAGLILIAGLFYSGVLQRFLSSSALRQTSTLASTSPELESSAAANTGGTASSRQSADSSFGATSLVEQGRDFTHRKDWAKAESAFRSALEASPANREAALGLSDVLYQEQKYEESAAVLNKLSSASKQ
jgi:tetratricopeptide (TPR) repeat protein